MSYAKAIVTEEQEIFAERVPPEAFIGVVKRAVVDRDGCNGDIRLLVRQSVLVIDSPCEMPGGKKGQGALDAAVQQPIVAGSPHGIRHVNKVCGIKVGERLPFGRTRWRSGM